MESKYQLSGKKVIFETMEEVLEQKHHRPWWNLWRNNFDWQQPQIPHCSNILGFACGTYLCLSYPGADGMCITQKEILHQDGKLQTHHHWLPPHSLSSQRTSWGEPQTAAMAVSYCNPYKFLSLVSNDDICWEIPWLWKIHPHVQVSDSKHNLNVFLNFICIALGQFA